MSKIFVNTFLVLIPFLSFSQDLEIKHLTEQINTIGSEFNFIQKDKNTAYYSSSTLEDGKYQTLIFKSEHKKGDGKKENIFIWEILTPIQIYLILKRKIIFFTV